MAESENPFITYYSPFSRGIRKKLFLRVFVGLHLALVIAFVANSIKNFSGELLWAYWWGAALYMLAYPQLCFHFFAPRNRTSETLEELLLTELRPWKVALGFVYGPVIVSLVLTAMIVAGFCVMFPFYSRADRDWGLLVSITAGLASLGMISVAVTARHWLRFPDSIVRTAFAAPLETVAHCFLALGVTPVLIYAIEQFLPNRMEKFVYPLMFSAIPALVACFKVWETSVTMGPRMYWRVDRERYQWAWWHGGEIITPDEARARAAAFRRVVTLVRSAAGMLARGVVIVGLLWILGGVLGYAIHAPGVAKVPGWYQEIGESDKLNPDRWTGALRGLFGWQTPFAMGIFLSTLLPLMMSRRFAERKLPIFQGGIVRCLALYSTPPILIGWLVAIACVGADVAHQAGRNNYNWLSNNIMEFTIAILVTGIGMSLFCVVIVASMIPARRRLLIAAGWLLFGLFIQCTPILSMYYQSDGDILTYNGGETTGLAALSLFSMAALFVGYGRVLILQRLHVLEVRDLPRFVVNLDHVMDHPDPPEESEESPTVPAP